MKLDGLRVAALVDTDFEQVELTEPARAMRDAGATVQIVSPQGGDVRGMNHDEKADAFPVDVEVSRAREEDYDALLIPGGVINADHLRMNADAVRLVRAMYDAGKPMAVICHGPWLLVEADVVRGRRLTSYPSLRTDIRNAGGEWVDEEVVVDRGMVTSRTPKDLPAFNAKMLEEFGEGTDPQRLADATATGRAAR